MLHRHSSKKRPIVVLRGKEWEITEDKRSRLNSALITVATSTVAGLLVNLLWQIWLAGAYTPSPGTLIML
jgi:hypothetical protein